MFVCQLEPAHVAAFVAGALHQADRIGPELLEMTVLFFAAGNPGHDGGCHLITPHGICLSSPSCESSGGLFVVGQRRFGLKFHVDHETAPWCFGDERDRPGEIAGPQEVVVAGLTPLGPVLQRGADRLGGQAPAHRGLRRAGVHDRCAHAGALELHLQVGHHRDQRGLRGAVGAHVRALAQRDVGAHEDQVAALTFDHARKHRGGQPVGADQMNLDLRFESRRCRFRAARPK